MCEGIVPGGDTAMSGVIVFGGTTEGRKLHEFLGKQGVPALTCVATEYGAEQVQGSGVRVGRMDLTEMAEFIRRANPILVADATHPYATEASGNIKAACAGAGAEYIRILRERSETGGCISSIGEAVERLGVSKGRIFAALGVKEAHTLTALEDYKERVWLRILPTVEGLRECLELGFQARRIICMQGPFSKELNIAMFRATGAKILVTKESGFEGGFLEKLSASEELGMEAYIIGRPEDSGGMSLGEVFERIMSL